MIPRPGRETFTPGGQFLDLLNRAAAERCAANVARPGLHVLELGAGTALWSRAIARRQPDALVTVMDLPPVLETVRQAAAADGLQGRYTFIAGDLFTTTWPADGSFNLVLVPNLCHLFGPEQAQPDRRVHGDIPRCIAMVPWPYASDRHAQHLAGIQGWAM